MASKETFAVATDEHDVEAAPAGWQRMFSVQMMGNFANCTRRPDLGVGHSGGVLGDSNIGDSGAGTLVTVLSIGSDSSLHQDVQEGHWPLRTLPACFKA
jgi:hypothetical protein